MASAHVPHDDPAVRTRWAWMRTALATLAVAALIARGLIFKHADVWLTALVIASVLAILVLATIRSSRLSMHLPLPLRLPFPVLVASMVCVMCAVAVCLAVLDRIRP